jgi:hypothetical protein
LALAGPVATVTNIRSRLGRGRRCDTGLEFLPAYESQAINDDFSKPVRRMASSAIWSVRTLDQSAILLPFTKSSCLKRCDSLSAGSYVTMRSWAGLHPALTYVFHIAAHQLHWLATCTISSKWHHRLHPSGAFGARFPCVKSAAAGILC